MYLAEIEWLDACSESECIPFESAMKIKPVVRKEIAYVINEEDDYYTIASGVLEDFYRGSSAFHNVWAIPKKMIKKLNILEVKVVRWL